LRREEEGKWWRRRTREAAAAWRAGHRQGRPAPSPWSRRDSTWGETKRERERVFFVDGWSDGSGRRYFPLDHWKANTWAGNSNTMVGGT